jgi:translation elongation factor EF-Ts
MTSAKALAQMTGHAEKDCADVLERCGGDVDRAIDRLLNSASSRDATRGRARDARDPWTRERTDGDRGAAALAADES